MARTAGSERDFGRQRFAAGQTPWDHGKASPQRPPHRMDIQMLRALLPAVRWQWPAQPAPAQPRPAGWHELAFARVRR